MEIIYRAFDGAEFTTLDEAENYERSAILGKPEMVRTIRLFDGGVLAISLTLEGFNRAHFIRFNDEDTYREFCELIYNFEPLEVTDSFPKVFHRVSLDSWTDITAGVYRLTL